MDWDLCLICQDHTREKLSGGNRSEINSYRTLSILLPQFAEKERFNLDPFQAETNDPDNLQSLFENKNAVYQKSCVAKFNQQKLDRLLKTPKRAKTDKSKESSSKRLKRNENVKLGELKCLFCSKGDIIENLCPAGTLHATNQGVNKTHVLEFTEKLKSKALLLGDMDVMSKLSTGDVAASELFYHKICSTGFNNRYRNALQHDKKNANFEIELQKQVRLNEVASYILDQRSINPKHKFEINIYDSMYKELLDIDGIPYSCHSSRFFEQLSKIIPGIDKRLDQINGKSVIYFTSTMDDILQEELGASSFLQALLKVVNPIRKEMSLKINSFEGDFQEDCQKESVPSTLTTLISLLINGDYPRKESMNQIVLTISQMIMRQFRKKPSQQSVKRHIKHRETPVPLYIGLKLYSTVRSKTLIDILFNLGICVSYDRVTAICNSIAFSMLDEFDKTKVFVPNKLRLHVFTIIAKDNIDFNAKSTKISGHFHGISMSILQLLSNIDDGKKQENFYDFSAGFGGRKLKLPMEYTAFSDPPFNNNSDIFAPVASQEICSKIEQNISQSVSYYSDHKKNEILWLDNVSEFQTSDSCFSWSKFHSDVSISPYPPGIHSLIPLIHEKVATLKSQFNCMRIIKKTIAYINPMQIPVDVSDCPVYALSKQIQMIDKVNFGTDKYVCMFGDLHIELELLQIHGELIKGSGLGEIMESAHLSTLGTSSIIDANNNKRARYCIEVAVCVIYKLLLDASNQAKDPIAWLEEKAKESQMCFYWKMILEFQIHILLFIRAIRQGNFDLYKETIYQSLKYFFAFDKYNYSRWISVYWFDLVTLQTNCPKVYDRFSEGHFSFQKTNAKFSKIGLDQLHEQNNKIIKGVGGATSLVNRNDETALNRWQLCGPDLSRMLNEFEEHFLSRDNISISHHEDNRKFQSDFLGDVKRTYAAFSNNPFLLSDLTVVTKQDRYFDEHVFFNLSNLLVTGEKVSEEFIKDRLLHSKVPINKKITLNHFILPGNADVKKQKEKKGDKRLNSVFYTKLRSALRFRREHVKSLFSSPIFSYSQSISVDEITMYHGSKSDILRRFPVMSADYEEVNESDSALIVELSPILRTDLKASTFHDYALKMYHHLLDLGKIHSRIDVICDRYFQQSLKAQTRCKRGLGNETNFSDATPFPKNFRDDFLRNNHNKEKLNIYLAHKFVEFHQNNRLIFTVTIGDTIQSNDLSIQSDESLNSNEAEEADQKIIRHMIQCIKNGMDYVTIRTVDTDVLILAIANRHHAGNFDSQVRLKLIGKITRFYNINDLALSFGERICQSLPFFHAFTGCDSVSSFFNQGKCKFWDRWQEFEECDLLTDTFTSLSSKPIVVTTYQLDILEKYLLYVYFNKIFSKPSINEKRVIEFEHSALNDLRYLPPCRDSLLEHTKRACYEGGWIAFLCKESVSLPDCTLFGWALVEGQYSPKWTETVVQIDIEKLLVTCSCSAAKCLRCNCSKEKLPCLPFCKCQRACLYKPL